MQQSEALTKFYKAYLSWVQAGAPEANEHGFRRNYGLCANLSAFDSLTSDQWNEADDQMTEQFKAAHLCNFYPFNPPPVRGDFEASEKLFCDEATAETMHENPRRLAWVLERTAQSWPCWSCTEPVTMKQRADADGDCPHCRAELDIEEWPFPEKAA